jgi:hypothetical protein
VGGQGVGAKVVNLKLEVSYNNKYIRLEKQAPTLPASLTWHKGLWIYDDDEGYDPLIVEAVYVNANGSVDVVFEERVLCDATDELIKEFTDAGWNLISGEGNQ